MNLFIIDHIPGVRDIIHHDLDEFNVDVFEFGSGEDAINRLEELRPEVIIIEYDLPNMTGPQFLIRVSELLLHNDWEVILVTNRRFDEQVQYSFKTLGITHVFEKPLNDKIFKETIKDILQTKHESVNEAS